MALIPGTAAERGAKGRLTGVCRTQAASAGRPSAEVADMSVRDSEVLIHEYVDGRLTGEERRLFEARLKSDPGLRERVETTTHTTSLLRKALAPVEPSRDFEGKVLGAINGIMRRNPELHSDPALKAPIDPALVEQARSRNESRRMLLLAAVCAVLFLAAALTITSLAWKQSHRERRLPASPATRT